MFGGNCYLYYDIGGIFEKILVWSHYSLKDDKNSSFFAFFLFFNPYFVQNEAILPNFDNWFGIFFSLPTFIKIPPASSDQLLWLKNDVLCDTPSKIAVFWCFGVFFEIKYLQNESRWRKCHFVFGNTFFLQTTKVFVVKSLLAFLEPKYGIL